MEWAEYSREIQEWAEKIEEFKVEQPRKALKYAEKMKKAGERTGDDFLLGHAYNAISDYYYRANDVEPFLKSLILAIEYLKSPISGRKQPGRMTLWE